MTSGHSGRLSDDNTQDTDLSPTTNCRLSSDGRFSDETCVKVGDRGAWEEVIKYIMEKGEMERGLGKRSLYIYTGEGGGGGGRWKEGWEISGGEV